MNITTELKQKELRNQLEKAILNDFVIYINENGSIRTNSQDIWDYRYRYFLNAIANNEILPAGVELQDMVNYLLENESTSILDYMQFLPGMKWPLEKNEELDPAVLQNHGWMTLRFYNDEEEYKRKVTPQSYCKLVFKEDNCFTLSIKDSYIHIQSNTNNILDFDWTIISTETNDAICIKNINFKNKEKIVYYIKNYKDLGLLEADKANDLIEMLMC